MSSLVASPVSFGLGAGGLKAAYEDRASSLGSPATCASMASAPHNMNIVSPSLPGTQPPLQLRKRSKHAVAEQYLANLAASKHPGAGDGRFIAAIHEHFQSLPTRYALDVNIASAFDVLNHKRLLEAARNDRSSIAFQVRPVDVSANQSGSASLPEKRPSFASTEMLLQDQVHAAAQPIHRLSSLPRPAFGSSPNVRALSAEADLREAEEAARSAEAAEFYEVTVASQDQPKLLSMLSDALGELELNICEAHAFNTNDKLVLDVFVVTGWQGQGIQDLEEALGKRLQHLRSAEPAASPRASTAQQAPIAQRLTPGPEPMAVQPAFREDGAASMLAAAAQQPHDDWELEPKDIQLHAKVASGAFGDLYKGVYCGQDVAIKILRNVQDDSQQYQEFLQEVAIMRKVRHKHVVQFIGACTIRPNLCIVFEFMSGGSVYDHIRKNGALPPTTVLKVAMEVCRGMDYLHKRRIVHRDLKAANLLLDEMGTVKIADFGVARVLDPHGVMTAETGTYRWMAPEVIEHNPYRETADIYSFGIVLWELITGQIPYGDMTPLQAAVGVVQKGLRPTIPPTCPGPISELMRACWVRNPAERPTFEALKIRVEQLYEASLQADKANRDAASKQGFFAKFKQSGKRV